MQKRLEQNLHILFKLHMVKIFEQNIGETNKFSFWGFKVMTFRVI